MEHYTSQHLPYHKQQLKWKECEKFAAVMEQIIPVKLQLPNETNFNSVSSKKVGRYVLSLLQLEVASTVGYYIWRGLAGVPTCPDPIHSTKCSRLPIRVQCISHHIATGLLVPGQLSLLSSAGWEMSTGQNVVTLCGWEVKAGMVHSICGCMGGWQIKLCDPSSTCAIPDCLKGELYKVQ